MLKVIPLWVIIISGSINKRLDIPTAMGRRSDLKSKYLRADRPRCDSHGLLLHTLGEREVGDPYASCSVPDPEVDLGPSREVLRLELALIGLPVFG